MRLFIFAHFYYILQRRIMKLLLKVKNGSPPLRKSALRELTRDARKLGAGPLFNQVR